ncbi:MAG: exopolysaccharide biosynthesis protein [Candidatus Saccharibacteria bacterium]|nr:exopolysaccharide biosynthesis protein [Pseudorhodobacter sp.]
MKTSIALQADPRPVGLTDTLLSLTKGDDQSERLSLAQILTNLSDQARGVLMILFALPNCVPGIPGTSAITGLPLVFLTLQMALNLPPWLPAFIANRSVSRQWLAGVMIKAEPWLRRIERLVHPRLMVLTSDTAERLVGAWGLVLSVVIMLPIPLGNTLPALSLLALSVGFVGRDGAWVLGGLVVSGLAAALLFAAGWAAFAAMIALWAHWIGF